MAQQTINQFRQSMLRRFTEDGWNGVENTSRMMVGGGAGWTVRRKFYIYDTVPPVASADLPVVWYHRLNRTFWKAVAGASPPVWKQVFDVDSLFLDTSTTGSADGAFNGGDVTVPIFLAREPQQPDEAASKAYVDRVVNAINAGTSIYVGAPVQDLDALRNLDITGLPDKHLRFVEDAQIQFSLERNADPSYVDDGSDVIASSTGPAWWISVSRKILNSGDF